PKDGSEEGLILSKRISPKKNAVFIMGEIRVLNNCPRCGNVAEAWTEDGGISVKIRCKMCGYEGCLPHPDLKNGAWRVG
ncbi:MAG: hypothetical protein PHQ34_13595, partial [Methanothrix sp.]|nr:hypothetical protein [Methanothrix sp.]